MKRILLFFAIVLNFIQWGESQNILKPTPPDTKNHPTITGKIWYKGYGENELNNENLKIVENSKPIEFSIESVENYSVTPKNKRIVFLIENHWLPIGHQERQFFREVITSGLGDEIEEGDEIAVYSFDWYRQGAYIFPETEGFTNDKDKIISAVNNIKPKTNLIQPQVGSDINQALMETLKLLGEKNDSIPTAIFLFSDELDNIVGKVPPVDIKIESLNKNIPIYAISYYNSSRYSKVLQNQICLPSFGEYYSDPSNNPAAAATTLTNFLSRVIENSRGSVYEYKYTSKLPKNTENAELQFELKKDGTTEKIALKFPILNPLEWVMTNPLFASILGVLLIVLIILISYSIKKSKKKTLQQQQELIKTQKELELQSAKAEFEKKENQDRFNKLQQEQLEKEKQKEAQKLKHEEERLLKLMITKGSFPKLTYMYQDLSGSMEVNHPVFTIGRETSNKFFIQIGTVSKKHATILFSEDGQYTLIDNNSSNGTFVNGKRIEKVMLKNGDHIMIGEIGMTFQN
jgi:hypothetical protein